MSNKRHPSTIALDAMREACRDPNGSLFQDIPSRAQMASVLHLVSDALEVDYWLLVYALVNAQEAKEAAG